MKKKLDNQINHRIASTAGLLKKQIYRIISEKGVEIPPEQWTILNYLWEDNGLSVGELVNKSKKDFANVTRIIEKLQKQGYVTKVRNEDDGRSYLIYHTEKAVAIKPSVEDCWKRSLEISLKNISKEEQELFFKVLEKIEENSLDYLNNTDSKK